MPNTFLRFLFLTVLGIMPAAQAATPLQTATVVKENLAEEFIADAGIEAVHRATMSAQTAGRIMELPYDVGDYVPRGSVIVRFRDTEPRARLEAAQATLKEATARHAEAVAQFKRIRDIHERKLVARAELDKATAALKSAEGRLEAARANVRAAEEGLEHTVVRAPYGGIVVERHVEIGESAAVGQPLMTGLSMEKLRVSAAVPQGLLARILAGNAAQVILPDGRRIQGQQLILVPCAEAICASATVRVTLEEAPGGLYPGMFVKAAFSLGEQPQLLIPATAVVHRSELTAVYVVDAGQRVSLRQIRTGRRHADGRIEVLAGLSEGEQVALDPLQAGVRLKQVVPAQ